MFDPSFSAAGLRRQGREFAMQIASSPVGFGDGGRLGGAGR